MEQGIVPFEFLGIVKDYNGVDITQTPNYVEMLCKNYISRLLKSHGWDTKSKSGLLESDTDLLKSKKNVTNIGTSFVYTVDKLSCAHSESCASSGISKKYGNYCGFPEPSETSEKYRNYCGPLISNESKQMHDSINLQTPVNTDFTMKTSCTIALLPSDCIDQLYKDKGPAEGSNSHLLLEKSSGFSYCTLLGELMYSFITCQPDIKYVVTTLSKFSSAPSAFHYKILKGVAKYLHSIIDWGIWFHCPKRLNHPEFSPSA